MPRVHDLMCSECGTGELDRLCPSDSTPPCSQCGSPTRIWWGSGSLRGRTTHADAFSPIVAGGKRYSTRDDWNGYLRTMRKQTGNPDWDVEGLTGADKRDWMEEHLHTAIEEARENGTDRRMRSRIERIYSRGAR